MKKLVEVSTKYREDNVKTCILGNKLVILNGTVYRGNVTKPRAEDLLLMYGDEKQRHESLDTVKSGPVTEAGTKFSATAAEVDTYEKVRSFYNKVVSDLECARTDHNIIVYRLRDKSSEYGAGRKILKAMHNNNVENADVVVTRVFANHIGFRRFSIMEKAAITALCKLGD